MNTHMNPKNFAQNITRPQYDMYKLRTGVIMNFSFLLMQ